MPLYEGKTVGEAMRKALGIEAKKTGKLLGRSKIGGRRTDNNKIPNNGLKPRSSTLKQQGGSSEFDTPYLVERARERAMRQAERWISRANVRPGANEVAVAYVYDRNTGRTLVLEGLRPGRRSVDGVSFYFTNGPTGFTFRFDPPLRSSRHKVLVTAHSHPQASRAGGAHARREADRIDEMNEGLNDNHKDGDLARMAPLYIKTPSGNVQLYYRR